jgi:hypothetical protein
MSCRRRSVPTSASSADHFVLSFSLPFELLALGQLLELLVEVRRSSSFSSSLASRLS